MPFRISGRNIDVGDALRERINRRVAEATAKYFDGGYSGHVTIGKEGFGFRTECVIHLDSGILLEAEALAADAYASADQAALADREAAAPLQAPAEGSSERARPMATAALGLATPRTTRAATSSRRRSMRATRK